VKRVLLFASGTFVLSSVEALENAKMIEVLGLVTQPPRPVGREGKVQATPAGQWAKHRGLSCYDWATLKGREEEIRSMQADVFLVADYGRIIPGSLLDLVPNQAINVHASLLPKYRGASPIAASLLNGDSETGVSIMVMTPGLDDGPVITTRAFVIPPEATTPTLYVSLSQLSAGCICQALSDYWTGSVQPVSQDDSQATVTKKITRGDGRAMWRSAEQEERKIRAYTPWPGVWTIYEGQRLKILQATCEDSNDTLPRGAVLRTDNGFGVRCDDGLLVPTLVQREGKKPEAPSATVHAWPKFVGSVLV